MARDARNAFFASSFNEMADGQFIRNFLKRSCDQGSVLRCQSGNKVTGDMISCKGMFPGGNRLLNGGNRLLNGGLRRVNPLINSGGLRRVNPLITSGGLSRKQPMMTSGGLTRKQPMMGGGLNRLLNRPRRDPCWRRISPGCVSASNIIKYQGRSLDECKQLCKNNPNCVAFEYGYSHGGSVKLYNVGDCQLNNKADPQGCDGKMLNLDLYIPNMMNPVCRN